LLNRNTEAERFLGGFTDILEHFWAALHQMIFLAQYVTREPKMYLLSTQKAGLSVIL